MFCWESRARAGLTLLLALLAADASAQTLYRCRSGGSTVVSQQPCTTGAASHIGVIGAEVTRYAAPSSSYSSTPGVGKAPDHLAYLGSECATLNDAIRTAPARGLRGTPLSDLHADYRTRCADEESEARQRLSRERSDQRSARKSEQALQKYQRELSVVERDQCHELLRILHAKRQRKPTMSEGEKADLDNLEVNFRARCTTQ